MISERVSATLVYYSDPVLVSRASFALESDKHWTASIYGDNLGNEDGLTTDRFSSRWNTWMRPRTIGLQFEYS